MNLKQLTSELLKIESQGSNAALKVFVRDSRSGACSNVFVGNITNIVDGQGPFDLEEGEFYLELITDH